MAGGQGLQTSYGQPGGHRASPDLTVAFELGAIF